MLHWVYWVVVVVVAGVATFKARGAQVTYDGRSLIIDGHRKILFSGSIHYPRSTPQVFTAFLSQFITLFFPTTFGCHCFVAFTQLTT